MYFLPELTVLFIEFAGYLIQYTVKIGLGNASFSAFREHFPERKFVIQLEFELVKRIERFTG